MPETHAKVIFSIISIQCTQFDNCTHRSHVHLNKTNIDVLVVVVVANFGEHNNKGFSLNIGPSQFMYI